MSPTEFDLRAALRDGEGDDPSVDRIVAGAEAVRSQRRTRVLSTAAAAVVVAGIAAGGVAFVSRSGDHHRNDPAGGTDVAAAAGKAGEASNVVPAAASERVGAASEPAAPSAVNSPPECPSTLPHTLLPGGGSPGQFGASGKLFAKPVAAISVCSYTDVPTARPATSATSATSAPGRTVLDGSAARDLADSLENARTTPSPGECPAYIVADAPSLAIIAVSTDGTVLPPVTTTLGRPACATQVSNGTVVRYGWTLPASLSSALSAQVTGTAGGGSSPSH